MKRILTVLKSDVELVEQKITEILSESDGDYEVLFDSMRYSALGGGKRIRPVLAIEFAKAFGAEAEDVISLAVAVELVHTYSLIHDDLPCMDDDDTRRGKPTNHKVFGEATALLSGDALLTLAFSVICSDKHLSDKDKVVAVKLLADFSGVNGMIGGQQIDLIGEKKRLQRKEHEKMNALKCGRLIKCACLMGCIAAGVSADVFAAAEEYADNIGLAFQVKDDIFDMGQEDGKTTYLSFMTRDEAQKYVDCLTEKAINAISVFKGTETLCDIARFLCDRTV